MVPMTMPTMAPVSRPPPPPESESEPEPELVVMTVVAGGSAKTVTVAAGAFCRGRMWERREAGRGRVGVGAILVVGKMGGTCGGPVVVGENGFEVVYRVH